MKKLLLYLLLFPALAFGQINKKLIHFIMTQGAGTPVAPRVTQYPQDRPTLTTPQTRASSGLLLLTELIRRFKLIPEQAELIMILVLQQFVHI